MKEMKWIIIYKGIIILLGETNEFSDHHTHSQGFQDLIVVPRPEMPYFIKTDKIISTYQLFEKFSCLDACGLVSLQALLH